jgi:phosphate transport system permease protein
MLDPATALPVQVYSWASRADPAFIERSAGAIIVLLAFLVVMNIVAILLRRRFERRW